MEICEKKKLLRLETNQKSCQDITQDLKLQLKTDFYMKKRNKSELNSGVNPNSQSQLPKKEFISKLSREEFTKLLIEAKIKRIEEIK